MSNERVTLGLVELPPLARLSYFMPGRENIFRYGLQPKRLLLSALLKGLADAVSANDGSAAYRYHSRLKVLAPDLDTNPAVSKAVERLLSASSQWLAANVAERHGMEQPVLDLIENINAVLGSHT